MAIGSKILLRKTQRYLVLSPAQRGTPRRQQHGHRHETTYTTKTSTTKTSTTTTSTMAPCISSVRVFVYDLPAELNTGTLRFYEDWAKMYDTEAAVPLWFERHPQCKATDWMTADYYLIPVYATRYMHLQRLVQRTKKVYMRYATHAIAEAIRVLNTSHPRWMERRDRHILALSHDFARCMLGDLRQLLSTTLVLTHLGDRHRMYRGIDCTSPYHDIVIPPFSQNVKDIHVWEKPVFKGLRPQLAVFIGAIRPKHQWYSYGVRRELIRLYKTDKDIIVRSGHILSQDYVRLLSNTTFCLSPAGYQTWSPRAYTGILSGCIPVFFHRIGDVRLPWDGVLDYSKFAVFIPTTPNNLTVLASLKTILRAIDRQTLELMQRNVLDVRSAFHWSLEGYDCGAMSHLMATLAMLRVDSFGVQPY